MKYKVETDSYYQAQILMAIANFLDNNNYLGDMLKSLSCIVSETMPFVGVQIADQDFKPSLDLKDEFGLENVDIMKADIGLAIDGLEKLRKAIERVDAEWK